MIVWSGVMICGGIITQMRAFNTKESAEQWFLDSVNRNGGKEACEEGDYDMSDVCMCFFDSLGTGEVEIHVEPVEVE